MNRHACLLASACWLAFASANVNGAETVATIKADRVNVRGQPSIFGDLITQLHAGEKVNLLEVVKPAKTKADEPTEWAKIQMPANTPIWVFASYVDATNKVVRVSKLNLRAGPGENFNVVGRLTKDTPVKDIRVVDDWMEIETPTNAYAFVALDLLETGAAAPAETSPPQVVAAPPPETTTPKAAEPTAPPAVTPDESAVKTAEKTAIIAQEKKSVEAAPPPKTEPVPATEPPSPPPPGPILKRIVRREGIIRSTVSIQAPTYYELEGMDTGKPINYLHPTLPAQKLKPLKGRHVIVTGEELIDPRWPRTPVIDLETIELAP